MVLKKGRGGEAAGRVGLGWHAVTLSIKNIISYHCNKGTEEYK